MKIHDHIHDHIHVVLLDFYSQYVPSHTIVNIIYILASSHPFQSMCGDCMGCSPRLKIECPKFVKVYPKLIVSKGAFAPWIFLLERIGGHDPILHRP
jgi:hypothetical protein